MKTARKAILLVLCAILLVVSAVVGTLAYFTDSDSATNTFTVGKVQIDIDEGKVDAQGKFIDQEKNRVKKNDYHLIPGQSYDKDPTVKVLKDSEDAWLFVKVDNQIHEIELKTADENTCNCIEHQMIRDNAWTKLDGVKNVYYQAHAKSAASDTYYTVFKGFTVDGDKVVNGTLKQGEFNIDAYQGKKIIVTAYAIQMAGFENKPVDAWNALNQQLSNS